MNRYIVRFGEYGEDMQYFIVSAVDMSDAIDIIRMHLIESEDDTYTVKELDTITAMPFDESAIIVRII